MARKRKLSKEAEQSLYFETMASAGVVAPDGMPSQGDGKEVAKNKERDLEMRVNFEQSQGPCSRCSSDMGSTGYITKDGLVCVSCASDIKRERDTRGAWWRRNNVTNI